MNEFDKALKHYVDMWKWEPAWRAHCKFRIALLDRTIFPGIKEMWKREVNYKDGE